MNLLLWVKSRTLLTAVISPLARVGGYPSPTFSIIGKAEIGQEWFTGDADIPIAVSRELWEVFK